MDKTIHTPVMLEEVIKELNLANAKSFVDVTLGGGGHTLKALEVIKVGKIVVMDIDKKALNRFASQLEAQGFSKLAANHYQKKQKEIFLVNQNFKNLISVLAKLKIEQVDAILADLGLSSDQLDQGQKGISFQKNEELDMRMDDSLQVKAKDLLNGLYKKELQLLFEKYADINFASKLAVSIVEQRKIKAIETTFDLKKLVQKIVPKFKRTGNNKHPEAKVFQALRIAVNDELNSLKLFLPQALEALNLRGRLAVISFHSGEDRIVKQFIKQNSKQLNIIQNLLTPSSVEINKNTRSRSAKLRVIEKI